MKCGLQFCFPVDIHIVGDVSTRITPTYGDDEAYLPSMDVHRPVVKGPQVDVDALLVALQKKVALLGTSAEVTSHSHSYSTLLISKFQLSKLKLLTSTL